MPILSWWGENSGPTKIKTINDEDTLKLEHQIIRQEFDYRKTRLIVRFSIA
jgi:hypothetical protein